MRPFGDTEDMDTKGQKRRDRRVEMTVESLKQDFPKTKILLE